MLYIPVVVVWAWLAQVLDADKNFSNAVKRVMVWMVAEGVVVPSADTGGYGKARYPTVKKRASKRKKAASSPIKVEPAVA